MKKRILGLLIALGLSIPTYASITVSPTKIDLNANKVRSNYATTAIEVKGDANQPMRFKAYAGYFKITDQATMDMQAKSDAYDISKKIRFVPSEFTIPPGKAQKLRVNIANIKNLPDGESRAILYIEDVNAKEISVPNTAGIGAQLILKTRVGVPIYVDKGKFVKKAEVETFEVIKNKDGYFTKAKILSVGNSKIRYSGKFQIVQGKKLIDEYSIQGKVVGDNNHYIAQQKIQTDKIPSAGEYTIRMVLNYDDENGNKKNIKKETILKFDEKI